MTQYYYTLILFYVINYIDVIGYLNIGKSAIDCNKILCSLLKIIINCNFIQIYLLNYIIVMNSIFIEHFILYILYTYRKSHDIGNYNIVCKQN